MAEDRKKDPYLGYRFVVSISGLTLTAGFSECSGLNNETDIVEYRNGDEKERHVRKLAGLNKYTNIVLKRGFTEKGSELWDWRQKVLKGSPERHEGTVTLQDLDGKTVLTWSFFEGWPSKLEGPSLNAKASEVAIETLEIAIEKLEFKA